MSQSYFNKGFALAEVLIGISVLATVFMAVSNILFSSIRVNQVTMSSFMAYELAQEGIELMRAVRDSHWRRNVAWNGNVTDIPGVIKNFSQNGCYTISLQVDTTNWQQTIEFGAFLAIDKNTVLRSTDPTVKKAIRLYEHGLSQNTILNNTESSQLSRFNRFICIEEALSTTTKVTSVVSWLERWNTESNPSTVELVTELTDWKGGAI